VVPLRRRHVDGIVVRIFLCRAMAHFTVGELHALVRFYSSSAFEAEIVAAIDSDEIRASAAPA
jgi:hypothetical protein